MRLKQSPISIVGTREQRQQRLADEVMGKKKRKENSVHAPQLSEKEADELRRRRKRDSELQGEIDAHNVGIIQSIHCPMIQ